MGMGAMPGAAMGRGAPGTGMARCGMEGMGAGIGACMRGWVGVVISVYPPVFWELTSCPGGLAAPVAWPWM